MGDVAEYDPGEQPLWRRIVNFPLIAMLIGVAVIALGVAIAVVGSKFATPAIPGFTPRISFELLEIPLLIILYKLVIRRLGEHPRDDLRLTGALRPLLMGLAGGFVLFALAVAIAAAIGIYRVTGEGDLTGLLPALLGPAISAAVAEEMLFRGVLFRWLEEFGGSWAALLLTSAFFGAAHFANPNATPIAAVGIAFEAGVLLGGAYMLTRSLWLPMGIHAAWNFTQGEIFDIPVSGTSAHGLLTARLAGSPLLTGNGFGLEASPIAMVVATAAGVWLVALAVRRGEVVKPWWVRRRALIAS
ncbi:MAG TPA: type II CAAX endopeptidase family protein [Sphingomicrobium sp.]|nr:type II CAAX endopeptidase family protein [Sphingomicrobium sp.]